MRSALTTLSTVALLAATTSPAAARPADMRLSRYHADPTPSVGVQHRYLGSDATVVTESATAAPARIVHITTAPDGGVDWVYVGIGAGLAGALMLGAVGVQSQRRPTMTPR